MIKKYLISLEQPGQPRYDQFFSHNCFNSSDFKVFGIKGVELSCSEYFVKGVAGTKRPLSPAEVGCRLSHMAALQDFLQSNAKYAYIFEDDIIPRYEFQCLEDVAFLGENFICSLGGVRLTLCKTVRGKILEQNFCGYPLLKVNKNYLDDTSYAMGYVIDRIAAQHYLDYHQVPHVADDWKGLINSCPDISFYMADLLHHPDLHELSAVNSTIQAERDAHPAQQLKYSLWYCLSLYYQYKLQRFKRKIARYTNQRYPTV
ncbi:glycosyltransferase family 25 protein [Alkanindiges sp. WGS2144]|uniref:glycosyltransferase family 25 protein n=1 Tax=Alkanindiges sp. WGS2144 TaxID=3366808 RepID=UPI0037524606